MMMQPTDQRSVCVAAIVFLASSTANAIDLLMIGFRPGNLFISFILYPSTIFLGQCPYSRLYDSQVFHSVKSFQRNWYIEFHFLHVFKFQGRHDKISKIH